MANNHQKLIDTARRILGTRANAEDAVQDAYVRGFDTFSNWRPPEPGWTYAVLRNIAIDEHRRLKRESLYAGTGSAVESSSDLPSEVASDCEMAVRHLLSRVCPSDAAAILLRDVFEFEYPEIAGLLDKSEPATRQLLHRARVRARGFEAHAEVEEFYVGLCCGAIEARDPAMLVEMLRGITGQSQAESIPLGLNIGARSASMRVQINGRCAIALVLNGVVLCIVPVGVQAMPSGEAPCVPEEMITAND